MKKLILLLALFTNNLEAKDLIFDGQNCLKYATIVLIVEQARDAKVNKKLFLDKIIEDKELPNEVKYFFYKEIELNYNLPLNTKYGNYLKKQCFEKGRIIFKEV